ncbi:chorismate mutase [Nonomuraea sp. NPDC050556]|uniref:chorismate mutase n=1 Tax=Nonomuraea sp. NPDC050556 TaxID=3364369 RepID=UPI0037A5D460
MSSTLEHTLPAIGRGGPAVVVGGAGADVRWVSLRGPGAPVELSCGAAFVEPSSADDLPAIAERAAGVVVGDWWVRDRALVRAVGGLGLPVIVRRAPGAGVEQWLEIAALVEAEGSPQVILCTSGDLDLPVGERPVLADISGNIRLAAAAVAAGADGVLLAPSDDATAAREAVALVGALLRPESPSTLGECRAAIDRVDAALATLLERRAALAGVVQTLKPVGGFAGRDPERERSLVATMARRAPTLGETRLAPIMNAVIEAGLHLAEERRRS